MENKIKNPNTGRWITVGGFIYNTLLQEYDESFLLSTLSISIMFEIDPFFVNYGKEACLYKAYQHDNIYAIRVLNTSKTNHEKRAYTLLAPIDGFVKLIAHYTLPSLPSFFPFCKNIKPGDITLYILEWIEDSLEDVLPHMTNQNKYQFLYDLVFSLQQAKQVGFQHNDIYYENIRVTKTRKPVLIDFGKSTIQDLSEEDKKKLQYNDFVSFYKLLDYMALSPKTISTLSTKNSKNKGISFDVLLSRLLTLAIYNNA